MNFCKRHHLLWRWFWTGSR